MAKLSETLPTPTLTLQPTINSKTAAASEL
ncbi:MAG: hypothetical protein RLZZ203_1030, partial [Cyanobacteriota bacterium]